MADRPQAGRQGGSGGGTAGPDGQARKSPDGNGAAVPSAARPRPVVPDWHTGLPAKVPEYQQVMRLPAEHRAIGAEPLNSRGITAQLGREAAPAKIGSVRVKLGRLVARG
ncbi:hypothetical protein GCM10010129_57260 [Streptomyces fumigatiscleroticus]|nr:hypothetical protein GCM10010129_57260 [Streptomyces fumigatiscleroticus]